MNKRIGLIGIAAALIVATTLFAGLAEGAASGKVIGMTSGGGNKGYGIVSFSPGMGAKRVRQTMTISTPIDNVQVAGTIGGQGVYGTNTGGQLTATLHDNSVSCSRFTTGVTTWTGAGKIVFGETSGTSYTMTLRHYTLTFWDGVSYANEKSSIAGDGVRDGTETGIDSFFKPTGFACSNPGSVLTSLSVIGVLKIAAP
jgi:hypothetical protein